MCGTVRDEGVIRKGSGRNGENKGVMRDGWGGTRKTESKRGMREELGE
jgi:hypothetical protein